MRYVRKVVFEGGFGVKTLGRPDPVDADTLFLAVSNTKAMTTLLLAELVDEHKLRWDELVTEAYPEFRLGDANTAGTGEAPGVRMHRADQPLRRHPPV
jgi:CubicO group peptidase (beta-lactamase class C family)